MEDKLGKILYDLLGDEEIKQGTISSIITALNINSLVSKCSVEELADIVTAYKIYDFDIIRGLKKETIEKIQLAFLYNDIRKAKTKEELEAALVPINDKYDKFYLDKLPDDILGYVISKDGTTLAKYIIRNKEVDERIISNLSEIDDIQTANGVYGIDLNENNPVLQDINSPNTLITQIKDFLKLENEIKCLQEKKANTTQISMTAYLDKEIDNVENKLKETLDLQFKKNSFIVSAMELNKEGYLVIHSNQVDVNEQVDKPFASNFSIDRLSLVHTTSYLPQNGVIRTTINATEGKNMRNTVHFAVNGQVSEHDMGTAWRGMPIIIIDPMKEHINQIVNVNPVDTWTYGSVKLSDNAIILIDSTRFDQIKKENEKVVEELKDKIVLVDGNAKTAVDEILLIMGCPPQNVETFKWKNDENCEKFETYFHSNYPNISRDMHGDENKMGKYFAGEHYMQLRNFVLSNFDNDNMHKYVNGGVISLEEFKKLFDYYCNEVIIRDHELIYTDKGIKKFLTNFGIRFLDNEIHIISGKDYYNYYDDEERIALDITDFQVEKCKLLLKKLELLEENKKEKTEEEELELPKAM